MYHVEVFNLDGDCLDSREFEFGNWQAIGFYLDNYGYNAPRYRVVITFSE